MIRSPSTPIAMSLLLIAFTQSGTAEKSNQAPRNCVHFATNPSELRALKDAVSRAQVALKAIDFAQTSVSYAQGNAIARGPIKGAGDFLGYAESFVNRAQTDPTLLFYWHAYSGTAQAAKMLRGAGHTLGFIKVRDEQSTQHLQAWRDEIDASADNLEKATDSFGEVIEVTLKSADWCLGVAYEQGKSAGKPNP